jgi:2-keto-4-pentenoate hydratase/2-oxohepta-3-ene-1,7-dioic acid hydratase in catechol pathway
MRLVTYLHGEHRRLGAVRGDFVVDLHTASGGHLPSEMITFLAAGDDAMQIAREVSADVSGADSLSDVTLLAPVPAPSKVIAIGLNYMDHCREGGREPPSSPVIFAKFPTSVIGPGAAIRWDPRLTAKVDFEVELAVIMGQTARRVPAANAMEHVAGFTVGNDVSARDLQDGDGQWVRGKSLDTFCPLGPWLLTRDEIADPHALPLRCLVNGVPYQDSTTAEMIFQVPELIAFASSAFTLLPGDVIMTGTPHGVGAFRDPPVLLKDGDVVTVEIDGIGSLTNPCVEEAQT